MWGTKKRESSLKNDKAYVISLHAFYGVWVFIGILLFSVLAGRLGIYSVHRGVEQGNCLCPYFFFIHFSFGSYI